MRLQNLISNRNLQGIAILELQRAGNLEAWGEDAVTLV